MAEKGVTGLVEFSGQIQEEFLRELRGKEGYKRFDEMRRNSPIIGALLLANELSIRKVDWEFVSDDGPEDVRVELLEQARANMSQSWNDFIIEALTMLPFGFSLFEVVYERRGGRVLWRKFAPRGQDTIYKWLFDDQGGLSGVQQQASPAYRLITLPIEKLLLFRTRVERGNPEGRSILRTAWVPYYYAKHIMQVEAIGIERDLAGLPVIKLPAGADTSDTDTSDLGVARIMVRNIRNDEQAGVVLPGPEWDLTLLSTGGSRQFDTDKIVRRYESRMLMSALAQFVMLGQDNVGSLALSKDATDFFVMAVNAVADIIAETFTKYAIPRLLALNGYDAEGVALTHTPAGDVDTVAIADFLQKVGGMVTWDAQDELWLRQLVGLPERDVDELQQARDQKAEVDNARNKAILEQARTAREGVPTPPDADEDDEEDMEDMMSVTRFAASPPDERKRQKYERDMAKIMEKQLARMKRDVLRAAKEMRATPSIFESEPQGQRGMWDALKALVGVANRPPQPVHVTVNGQPVNVTNQIPAQAAPDVHVHTPEQPAPVVNFAPTIQPPAAPGVTVVNQVNPTPIQNTVNVPPAEPFVEAELTTDKDGKKVLKAKRNGK